MTEHRLKLEYELTEMSKHVHSTSSHTLYCSSNDEHVDAARCSTNSTSDQENGDAKDHE